MERNNFSSFITKNNCYLEDVFKMCSRHFEHAFTKTNVSYGGSEINFLIGIKVNVRQPYSFPPGKIYWMKYWENININKNYWLRKVNIDTINWEKLSNRSIMPNNAICRDSLTLIFWEESQILLKVSISSFLLQTDLGIHIRSWNLVFCCFCSQPP